MSAECEYCKLFSDYEFRSISVDILRQFDPDAGFCFPVCFSYSLHSKDSGAVSGYIFIEDVCGELLVHGHFFGASVFKFYRILKVFCKFCLSDKVLVALPKTHPLVRLLKHRGVAERRDICNVKIMEVGV